ncbi:MAG: S-methyl-5'-thioinosine phosphorylase [Xanthomonadales bacterium]|nr:S-methyl-5'-thioinosine phosphorylase [Xanthomonadales bacterium]
MGLIGGTGLDQWGDMNRSHDINGPYGQPSAPIAEYHLANLDLFFLARHGVQHECPPHAINYQANIDAFRQLGVDGIIAINAVGGISSNNAPGSLTVPDQLIDYTWGRAHSFSMTAADELQHVEFANPFSTGLRAALIKAAETAEVSVTAGGCVGVTQGPRLETAAEILRFKQDGCDLAGMTTMPEAALAREAGIEYASLCVNANWAAGLDPAPISMQDIEATLKQAMFKVRKLLDSFFKDFTDVS